MLIVNMKRFILVFTVNIALMLGFRVQAQEYVDLGLSVNWATYNVGANNIEELGEKFVAGTTIKWQKGRAKTNAVIHINGFSGNAEYDAATANWGQGWRTPTRAEWEELIRRCKWKHNKLVLSNGTKINGAKITGPNGNSIFLHYTFKNMFTSYQTSTPHKRNGLWVLYDGLCVYNIATWSDVGFYVRPVINKE